jgi:hypothetical protein
MFRQNGGANLVDTVTRCYTVSPNQNLTALQLHNLKRDSATRIQCKISVPPALIHDLQLVFINSYTPTPNTVYTQNVHSEFNVVQCVTLSCR